MVFKKGGNPWNKGTSMTDEQKKKLSLSCKGRPAPNKGKHHSEETKRKISEAKKGKSIKMPPFTEVHRKNLSKALKNHIPWNKGMQCSEELKQKLSKIESGTGHRLYGKHHTPETLAKMSEARKRNNPMKRPEIAAKHVGEKNHMWKGGKKLRYARYSNKKRQRGFILITDKNPYNEPIEYHHINPDLPYVVPCPARIHKMFPGSEKTHAQNVNAMLGIKINFHG